MLPPWSSFHSLEGAMNRMKRFAVAIAAGLATTVAVGPAVAVVQSYDPSLIAYSYVYYADAEKTEVLGYAWDNCVSGIGGHVWVQKPYIPTPYYDETPAYVCSGMGPWLPPDW